MSKGRYKFTFRLPPELDERAAKEAKQQSLSLNDYIKTMAIRGMLVGADDSQYEFLAKLLIQNLTIIQRLTVKVCELDDLNDTKARAMQDATENILAPAKQDTDTVLIKHGFIKE